MIKCCVIYLFLQGLTFFLSYAILAAVLGMLQFGYNTGVINAPEVVSIILLYRVAGLRFLSIYLPMLSDPKLPMFVNFERTNSFFTSFFRKDHIKTFLIFVKPKIFLGPGNPAQKNLTVQKRVHCIQLHLAFSLQKKCHLKLEILKDYFFGQRPNPSGNRGHQMQIKLYNKFIIKRSSRP